ncbi:MAG: primosomal protein N' [Phycisphaerae bacterium]|nr:primosomal protein N' [Phycisphaerae bacterium]
MIRRLAQGEAPPIPSARIKPIEGRDPRSAPLPPTLVELARWIASYYCCPLGITVAGLLPAAVKLGRGRVTRVLVDLPPSELRPARMTKTRRSVLDALGSLPPEARPVEIHELASRAGISSPAPIRAMIRSGLLRAERRSQVEAEWMAERIETAAPPSLTRAQQQVVDSIGATIGAGFSRHLLHGVTGSGKTEVYIRLMRRTIDRGLRAIMLVPEISLTPQTGGRIMARFPDVRVAVLHSGLTDAQRHRQWAMAADGSASIVLGARSAVFAPLPPGSLGLVIVDEEHDASYKQDQQPRYHGRDVAIRLAQLAGCPVLLGSATPSLESWQHAKRGDYALHRLPERAPGLTVPRVRIVDFGEERRKFRDRRVRLLGPTLERAVHGTIEGGGQVLLLLNRRGYGNYVACADHRCGWIMRCSHCDAGMICHQERVDGERRRWVRCHHCQEEQRLPPRCPECGKGVAVFGLGTQRVEEELAIVHPLLSKPGIVERIDGDTMRSSRELHAALSRFGRGESRLLVGTQMIAKGLDFPGVRLVGVVNADTAIHLPDFRAAERTFQLVAQVAGRCGRGADAGDAIVQSFVPETPALRHAAKNDFDSFAQEELDSRKRFSLPPWRRMVRIVVRHEERGRSLREAKALAESLGPPAKERRVEIRGPAPCALERIADRWRYEIELFAESTGPLQDLLAAARTDKRLVPGELVAVDVDPISLL